MEKMICPSCGKELDKLKITAKPRNIFWCEDCDYNYEIFDENTMQMYNDRLMACWDNLGEGVCGDYNAEDPDDANYLRFEVLHNVADPEEEPHWEEIDDASYCTLVTADTPTEELLHYLWIIFKEYDAVYDDYLNGTSLKKVGERLSWIGTKNI